MKNLSKQEYKILVGLKDGLKNKHIAQKIGIDQKVVGSYLYRLKGKLGLSKDDNVYKVVTTAIEAGII